MSVEEYMNRGCCEETMGKPSGLSQVPVEDEAFTDKEHNYILDRAEAEHMKHGNHGVKRR